MGDSVEPAHPAVGALQAGRKYSVIRAAEGPAATSSLELLRLHYPFSQVGLLTAREFAGLAGQRHSRGPQRLPQVDERVLEELHRCGVLVPLFRVDLTVVPGAQGVDVSGSLTAQRVHTTVTAELFRAAADGRLADPAAESFVAWPRERRRALWPSADTGYLYSRHQLLGLDVAARFVARLEGRRDEDNRPFWHLDDDRQPNQPTRDALGTWRGLAITLSALDTYYWPQITHALGYGLVAWRRALERFDAPQMLIWLGLSPDQLERQATSLRAIAGFRDDMGEFWELIRRAKSTAWESLRGDAAAALDYRLAADILDRFVEELDPGSEYTPARGLVLEQEGLQPRPGSLDKVLTDLHLSPFPELVIGVEGATEFRMVPRVLDLLGIEQDRNLIAIVDFGGTGRDLSLLARYAAEPVLGRDYGNGVALDRPLTRFLVMTDAENRYRTPAGRRLQRRLLLESLTANVPEDLRSDYYINTRWQRVVEIVTWGRLPFEFAHFTDRQLADAMLSIAKVPYPHDRTRLVQGLHMQRTHNAAPDVREVFWHNSGITKPALADALWPILEQKINNAIQRGHQGPPVMRACLRAYEMASVTHRLPMMLRRRPWRPHPRP